MCKKYICSRRLGVPAKGRGGSPSACRGGGGPLTRNARQYFDFASFGRQFHHMKSWSCFTEARVLGWSITTPHPTRIESCYRSRLNHTTSKVSFRFPREALWVSLIYHTEIKNTTGKMVAPGRRHFLVVTAINMATFSRAACVKNISVRGA